MHHHTLPPANSGKQQDVCADVLHPKLTQGGLTGVSRQPKLPLGQLPLMLEGGQCREPQAGLCARHRQCLVLRVPGWQTPAFQMGLPSPLKAEPHCTHVSPHC